MVSTRHLYAPAAESAPDHTAFYMNEFMALSFCMATPSLSPAMPKQPMEPSPMPNRIIRLRTVLDRTGLSRSTLYRKIGDGTFPPQLRISVHGAGWSEAEVERWVANPAGWRIQPVASE
jgi:prophage regulatory protein